MRSAVGIFIGILVCLPSMARGEDVTREQISLQGIWAQKMSIDDVIEPDTKAAVFVVFAESCATPDVAAISLLTRLEETQRAKGVRFVALYPEPGTDAYEMATHGAIHRVPFWLLRDESANVAAILNLTKAGEAVVVDKDLTVQFRGAVGPELEAAVTALGAGRAVTTRRAELRGCPLSLAAHTPAAKTYAKDVAPIMRDRCETCHREGQPVPFTLETYAKAFKKKDRIRDMVGARRMPPFTGRHNEAAFGPLAYAPWLSESERQTIVDWVETGAAEGDPSDLPPAASWPAAGSWGIGTPDGVFEMPVTYQVPGTGTIPYQFYRVKIDSPTDRWVKAVEMQPGNYGVVHHLQGHFIESGDSQFSGTQAMLALYGLSAKAKLFGAYTPGDNFNANVLPEGEAIRIPAHSDVVLEVHYMPNGTPTSDRSRFGIVFADGQPTREIKTKAFQKARGRFVLPAGDPNVEFTDEYYFEKDVRIFAIHPHMHARGKSFRIELVHADGRTESVLTLPVWDFNWQRTYQFKTPIFVPTTAVLKATATYDNSYYNPNNPDPEKDIIYGLQTDDEMFNCRFNYYEVDTP